MKQKLIQELIYTSKSYIFSEICKVRLQYQVISELRRRDIHIFDVNISVSRPCRTSPLKYEARGP